MVISRFLWPSKAATDSRRIPRLMAWVREGVAKLVRVDVADPSVVRDPADHAGNAVAVHGRVGVGEEPSGARDVDSVVGLPFADQVDECRVQRDVAVVAELAGVPARDPQARLHDERDSDTSRLSRPR